MGELGTFLSLVWDLILRACMLDPEALGFALTNPYALWLTTSVALVAGLSVMLGHAAVLLLNRIHGWQLVIGLALSGFSIVMLHVVESVILWLLGSWLSGHDVGYLNVLSGVFISMAPQVLGFLVLIPYAGQTIGRFLSGWSLVVLWVVTADLFTVGRWAALGIVGAAWLIMTGLSMLCAPPIARFTSAMFERRTGRQFQVSSADVLSGRPLIATEVKA